MAPRRSSSAAIPTTKPEPQFIEVEWVPIPSDEPDESLAGLVANLGRRDILMMGVGAGSLLVLELVGFLLGRQLFGKNDESSDEEPDTSEERFRRDTRLS